jgi:hypothetical protein
MIRFTAPKVLEAALWIQLCDKKALDIDLSPDGVRFHLPSQHLLSLYCSVPPGEMLSILSDMEESGLIIKEERRGLWTTSRGNILVAEIIEKRFKKETRALLGQKMLRLLLKRFRASLPDQETASQGKDDDNRSSAEYKERFVSKDKRALKRHICKSCRSTFFTNDARRKKCDLCLQEARFKLIRSQKKR